MPGLPYQISMSSGRIYDKLYFRHKGDWHGRPILVFENSETGLLCQINPSYIESIDEVLMSDDERLYGIKPEPIFDDLGTEHYREMNKIIDKEKIGA